MQRVIHPKPRRRRPVRVRSHEPAVVAPERLRLEAFALSGGEFGVDAVYAGGRREAVVSFVGPYAREDCALFMRAVGAGAR